MGLSDYLDPTSTGTLVLDGYPMGGFANDASVSITGPPESVVCGAQDVAIEVTISNKGESTLTTCLLEYAINGGPTLQQSWGGSLAQFESETVTLNAFTTEDGVNTVEVTLVTPNGVEDENNANNTAEVEFSSFTGTTVGYSLQHGVGQLGKRNVDLEALWPNLGTQDRTAISRAAKSSQSPSVLRKVAT